MNMRQESASTVSNYLIRSILQDIIKMYESVQFVAAYVKRGVLRIFEGSLRSVKGIAEIQ